MDAVEMMLFCVVSISVLVFLILENLESLEKGKKAHHHHHRRRNQIHHEAAAEEEQDFLFCKVKENYFPQDEQSVGARDDEAETQTTSGSSCYKRDNNIIVQEIVEEEESEQLSSANEIHSEERFDLSHDEDDGGEKDEQEGLFDDWEGVERTELEKSFDEAVVFVGCRQNGDRIGDEQKLELYGLQKVALEGPCRGSQPMALKVSARSKWNAWHKLGNMSQETAMEKYVDVLSKAIPGWKGEEDTRDIQDS